jgi:MFS family permease
MPDSKVDAPGPIQDASILATLRESPPAVKAVLAGILVNRLGQFITIYLVLFMTHRGFSADRAGVALGGYGAGGVVGIIVGTALADWLGPRWGTVLSMAGRSVLIIAILYVRNFYAVVVIVALVGMIGLVYRPATAALLSELTPKHRQVMIFALYRMGLNVGTTIAPIFGYLLILGSYNLLFWGEAAAGIIYTVIALAALPRRGVRAGDDIAGAVRKRWAVAAVFADRRYTLFLGALLINATVYIQYVSVLPLAMRAAGIATIWYATLLTLNSAIVIGCELLMTKMTQRWPARVVALAGFALLGCGLALYSVPGGLLIFIAGTLVWTLAEITAGPTMSAYPANAGPAALKSKYLGTSQAAFTLGFAIGPAIGVFAWDQVHTEVWWLYGAASLVGLVLAWYGMRPAGYSEEIQAALSHGDTAATA